MQIRRVRVERFRCLRELEWHPAPCVNVLIGPGDIGKTAILDAIELALTPAVVQGADETDYTDLDVENGLSIELVIGALSDEVKASIHPAPLWGWNAGTRELTNRPTPEDGDEEVIRVRVRGTPDLELEHELLSPGAGPRRLAVQNRVALSMWSVGVRRSPEAELRRRRGALLERALGGDSLRGSAVQAFRGLTDTFTMPEEANSALERVSRSLDHAGVPTDGLGLGVVSSRGQSPVATFGLVVNHGGPTKMPFGSFGRGTQQLAMVALAAARASEGAIAIADEIETGLEPYRQRQLFGMLRNVVGKSGQAFITTHSPTVLQRARAGEVWRVIGVGGSPRPSPVDGQRIPRLLSGDPTAFFARLLIVGEGITEVGFLTHLLRRLAESEGHDLDGLGIHLANGEGHGPALQLIDELHASGHRVMGFVDNELELSGTRLGLIEAGVPLHVIADARNLAEAVARSLSDVQGLDALIDVPGRLTAPDFPERRCQQLGDALGKPGNLRPLELVEGGLTLDEIRNAIARAAHKRDWFKSLEAGANLGAFVEARVVADDPFRRGIAAFWEKAKELLA